MGEMSIRLQRACKISSWFFKKRAMRRAWRVGGGYVWFVAVPLKSTALRHRAFERRLGYRCAINTLRGWA